MRPGRSGAYGPRMATSTKQRSLLRRILRALLRRKDPAPRNWPGNPEGNAGVREPRRPKPNPPAMAATADEQS